MHALDARTVGHDDPTVAALHNILIRAYDGRVDALALAGQVGILRADIAIHPKLRHTWWSILEEAAAQGELRRLIETALRDPTRAGWHDRIHEIVAIAVPAQEPEPEPQTQVEKRRAARRPVVGGKAPLWQPGTTIGVQFLEGSSRLRKGVEEAALQWLEVANLKFEFGDDPNAPIRVSFSQPGAWSYQGTECLSVASDEPTTNFGWLTDHSDLEEINATVLHEFGHVLGLLHEHSNPCSTIPWDTEKAYEHLAETSGWTRAQVDHYLFSIWPPGYYPVHKVYDPESIMQYPIDSALTKGDFEIGRNQRLSPVDKQFVAALYRN